MNPQGPDAARPPMTALPPSWLEWKGSGCVLVIDDDEAIRTVLSRALSKLGFTANVAADGLSAVALFNAAPTQYVLVLLDYKLPGMDSRDVFREIRAMSPGVRVVLMSGYSQQEAVENSAGMDLSGFLHKPFTLDAMASSIRCALAA